LLILCGIVDVIHSKPGMVLVRAYHGLSCNKADQDDPGVNDMALIFFQNPNTITLTSRKGFSLQKYSNRIAKRHPIVTMSL